MERISVLPPDLLEFARNLRQSQTDTEQILWRCLRNRRLGGFKFRRQHPIEPYLLDFYCREKKLAVELDGGQHNEPNHRLKDDRRTEFLTAQGIRVLRFWNDEMAQETEAVLEVILRALQDG